jgi:cyclophilin family peptidyl-prolyl cis-trans isomerase
MIARRIFLICCLVLCILLHAQIEDVDNNQNDHPLVECETTKGSITIEVIPNWSPLGAERFLQLIDDNFFTNIALYRCVKRFLTQFGISDNPTKRHWHHQSINDDPNLNLGIKKNYVSFAGGGPNTRSTQIFIAFEDLDFLGKEPWETPFGISVVHSRLLTFFIFLLFRSGNKGTRNSRCIL